MNRCEAKSKGRYLHPSVRCTFPLYHEPIVVLDDDEEETWQHGNINEATWWNQSGAPVVIPEGIDQ